MASINYTQSLNNTFFYGNDFQTSSVEDFQLAPEIFTDFDSIVFQDDTEKESNLLESSKKICKASKPSYKSKKARNPWTSQEDAKVTELMKKYGKSWAMISSQLEGRTGKQVRDRFLNKLRPNIKCGDWSAKEDELLVQLLREVGNKWSLIATHLPGRTEGQVKNRFYSYIKKRLQPDGTLSLISDSKANSEDFTSFTTSPQMEEIGCDFGNEFDVNMISGCSFILNNQESTLENGNYAVTKGPYGTEEEMYSEGSTTQSSNSQSSISTPLRMSLIDPTDVISYNAPEIRFYREPSSFRPFHITPIQHDNQVDTMLNKVTNYFVEASNKPSESADSFLAQEINSQDAGSDDRLTQLNMRKAYLELALAKTLQEINGF